MTHVRYLVGGYAATFGLLAAYAAWVVARSRSLARALAVSEEPEDRRT